MKASFLPALLFCLYACSNQVDQKSGELVKSQDSPFTAAGLKDTIAVNHNSGIEKDTVPKNIQVDTVIHLAFAPGSSRLEAKGTLNKQSQPVICYLPVDRRARFIAKLIPENKNLNVRFSQIISPDGKADGPFGRQLKYNLMKNGIYKIIIGPNQMADGLRSGDFWIKIEVKEIK